MDTIGQNSIDIKFKGIQMILRIALASFLASTLAACATNPVDPDLYKYGEIKLTTSPQGYQIISGVGHKYKTRTKISDTLPLCIAQIIENRGVILQDSETNVGPVYGTLIRNNKSLSISGGNVITYVSDDKKTVIARGAEDYQTGLSAIPIKRNIRYTMTAKIESEVLDIFFNKLEWAQLDTGGIRNDGYSPLGAWSGAQSDKALIALKNVAEKLNDCVASN